jgi:hypothetical protein
MKTCHQTLRIARKKSHSSHDSHTLRSHECLATWLLWYRSLEDKSMFVYVYIYSEKYHHHDRHHKIKFCNDVWQFSFSCRAMWSRRTEGLTRTHAHGPWRW